MIGLCLYSAGVVEEPAVEVLEMVQEGKVGLLSLYKVLEVDNFEVGVCCKESSVLPSWVGENKTVIK